MKDDRPLLVVTHLSQLLTVLTGFGGLIVPLVIWLSKRNESYQLDEHGKNIINFQLSLIVNCIICVPLILFFGLGILGFIVLGIVSVVFPIINAIKTSHGENPTYPLSFNFIH
ncbi:DUF4870 domain-containing protein [Lacinutrix neustonica]|uniref:DUF4870 domain-containing protein n=1 Tax=Lacinutrix neustonica TaxID=2980107 RepID=A0A9E8MVQ0_9FLAO|nr:DUF4870 domain-containing protein [Lacinutrix neustonica]WAC02231.1 DUF4870 domain-containing protein [Lacinutrix neustonica]